MALRIRNERVHQLAKELAAMTGQTQVSAIRRALEERLARIDLAEREDTSPLPRGFADGNAP